MSGSLLLQTFAGTNTRVPVWFMRQAGRFLPEYRTIREKRSLNEMFREPEVAAEITCQPVAALGVDAAILFADILTLPGGMGFQVEFSKDGPVVRNPVRTAADVGRVHEMEGILHIPRILQIARARLSGDIALIGFAGSPFTVAAYLLEEGPGLNIRRVLRFSYEEPSAFQDLIDRLTRSTIAYLKMQKEAGAEVYQLFDSWGGVLPELEYRRWILPSVKEILRAVPGPSIYYLKNCHHLIEPMKECGADFLSVCETVDIASDGRLKGIAQGIQGNIFNGMMYAPVDQILAETRRILTAGQQFRGHIFNLSHGIHPDMDPAKARQIVDEVHAFKLAAK